MLSLVTERFLLRLTCNCLGFRVLGLGLGLKGFRSWKLFGCSFFLLLKKRPDPSQVSLNTLLSCNLLLLGGLYVCRPTSPLLGLAAQHLRSEFRAEGLPANIWLHFRTFLVCRILLNFWPFPADMNTVVFPTSHVFTFCYNFPEGRGGGGE